MIPFKALFTDFHRIECNHDEDTDDRLESEECCGSCYPLFLTSKSWRNERIEKLENVSVSIEESDHEASCSSGFWRPTTSEVELEGGIWRELNGSLGDLGTFVPAALALTLVNGLDLGTTLVFTGIYNLATGLLFGIPIPVQPMSAIVVAAIASNPMTIPQIVAAGMITGLVLGILGITGLINFIYRSIPISVVRGVMLSSGLMTGIRGVKYILLKQDLATMQSLGFRSWLGVNGLALPISMLLFLGVVTGIRKLLAEDIREGDFVERNGSMSVRESLLSRRNTPILCNYRDNEAKERNWRRILLNVPTALIILLTALILAIVRNPSILKNLEWGPSPLKFVKISWEDWKAGLLHAAIYQIPASILSSVISLSKLSSDYFRGEKATPSAVCLSVWAMNWLGCWFGAVPVDHGAVGLAGQYNFGARSGQSMVMLGTVKLVLGLLLGSSLSRVLSEFPDSVMGILLLLSGIEMVWVCRDRRACVDRFVMVAVVVVSCVADTPYNITIGFLGGIVLYLLVKLY